MTKERFTTLADDGETGDGPELTLHFVLEMLMVQIQTLRFIWEPMLRLQQVRIMEYF